MDYSNLCTFRVPDEKDRAIAIGTLFGEKFTLKKSLNAIIPFFSGINRPEKGDWLWEMEEDGQTYDTYRSAFINKLSQKRSTIYLAPFEKEFDPELLQNLQKIVAAYYPKCTVKLHKTIVVDGLEDLKKFDDYRGKYQYEAGQVLQKLKPKVSKETFCLMTLTMKDLYYVRKTARYGPEEEQTLNWVFGLATLRDRVGIFSFDRISEDMFPSKVEISDPTNFLHACAKIVLHEIGHMFGMKHCIYFNCLMNGCNSPWELWRAPILLCPVCVRKLQYNMEFNYQERYENLAKTFLGFGGKFIEDAKKYQELTDAIVASIGSVGKPSIGSVTKSIPSKKIV